ncbi:hypothetical protein NE865_09116 [Phthorimaea operculella]|nr:hypothetical protein NE865_09116 [Phthorimaea operculella]
MSNSSKGTLNQSQSFPDMRIAAEDTGNVNISRHKRPRPDLSPPSPIEKNDSFSPKDSTKNDDKSDSISTFMATQSTLMTKLLFEVQQIKTQNTQIQQSNSNIEESMTFINKRFEELQKEVNDLKKERCEQKAYIESLETKIKDMQVKSRSSTIEIRNVPRQENETPATLENIVYNLGNTVGTPISRHQIRDIYRLPGDSKNTRPIVAEFTTVETQHKLLSATKAYSKGKNKLDEKLNTTKIGLPGTTRPIHVSEQLPLSTKKLLFKAQEFKRLYSYQFCWVSNGNIFLRFKEGSNHVLIKSEQCLKNLAKEHNEAESNES